MKKYEWNLDGVGSFLRSRKLDMAFLVTGLGIGLYYDWTTVQVVFFLLFLWSILGPIASRILALATLVFFSLVPVLLAFKRPERAEEFAIYAYYFLVMAVVRAVIEVRTEVDEESTRA